MLCSPFLIWRSRPDHNTSGFDALKVKVYNPLNALEHRDDPIFVRSSEIEYCDQDAYEAAVFWAAETSTDPDFVVGAALGVTAITWQPTRDVFPAMERFRDTFITCFPTSPPLRVSSERHAIACARGYYYLYPFTSRLYIDRRLFHYIRNVQVPDNWSTELQFVFNLIRDWWAGVLSQETHIPIDTISDGNIDLVTRQFYHSRQIYNSRYQFNNSFDVNRMEYMQEMERVVFTLPPVDPNTFTSWLLCLGVCCGVAVHPHDLAVLDKSDYCESMLEAVLAHFAKFLFDIPDSNSPEAKDAFEKLRSSLSIIIVLAQKLESSLNLYRLLWIALYMFMAISRFTGDASGVCGALVRYFQDKKEVGERFVDPEWRKMLTDFQRCNLDVVLDEISPNEYLEESVVDWSERFGFKLMGLYPHPRPGDGGSAILPSIDVNVVAENVARHSIDDTSTPLALICTDRSDPSGLSSVSVERPPAASGVLLH